MSDTTKVIGYCWELEGADQSEQGLTIEQQKQSIFNYCGNDRKILHFYVEAQDRKRKSLPEFIKAVAHAKREGAELVVGQLQNLTRYTAFTDPLLAAQIQFKCLDQPLVTDTSLPAVVENAKYLRERHSRRIREGLDQTMAQLGNPHALQEITKVNKPKTESAILFALVLAPIVAYYRIQGLSQRAMVQTLNEEGFLAPEGGPWVLSQLQKVLERVDMNNVALDLCDTLDDFVKKQYTTEQMIKALKAMGLRSPNREEWEPHTLSKVIERLHQIREILDFNEFVLELYPVMLQYESSNMSHDAIAKELSKKNIKVPERVLWELKQDQAAGHLVALDHWDAQNVDLTMRIAKRRKDDIESFIRPETLARSEALFKQFVGDHPTEKEEA